MKKNLEQLYLFILDTENKWFFGCSNVNKWKTVFVKLLTSFDENSSNSMEKRIEYLLHMNSGSIYVYEPGTQNDLLLSRKGFDYLRWPNVRSSYILSKRNLYGIQTNVILNYSLFLPNLIICKHMHRKIKK